MGRELDPHLGAAGGQESSGNDPAQGRKFWLALVLVFIVTSGLHFYGLDKWSWGEDEVHSLIELRVLEDPHVKGGQLPQLVPVWYEVQGILLRYFPLDEWHARVLSAACGVAAIVLAFVFAARHRGLAFAVGLAVLLDGSQLVVWLSQQNRFYSMAMLFLTLTLGAVWARAGDVLMIPLCALLAVLTVLCHNLLLVMFVMGFASACVAYPLGWAPLAVLLRSGAAALAGILLYVVYLRPLIQNYEGNWVLTTPVVVSFVAQVGIPTLALALFGGGAGLVSPKARKEMGWWIGLAAAALVFLILARKLMPAWSARYALLFMPPFWVLAAYGMERVARALGSVPLTVAWYTCAACLLLPKLVSHYQDGSRHDFRQAARFVAERVGPGQTIYCNWPPNLRHYLPKHLQSQVAYWPGGEQLPLEEAFVVYSSNVWEPTLSFPGRQLEVVSEIARRRFDEQSHVIRIYRVGVAAGGRKP